MSDETKTVSNSSRWTDAEKLQVFFSIIDATQTIEWKSVKVPEGRTPKAVRHMLDQERKKMAKEAEGGAENGNSANKDGAGSPDKPKKKRASPKKKAPAGEEDGADGAAEASPTTTKRKRAPPKKKAKAGEGERDDGDVAGASPKKRVRAKKVKDEPKEDDNVVPKVEPADDNDAVPGIENYEEGGAASGEDLA